jgi:hypothetical protein
MFDVNALEVGSKLRLMTREELLEDAYNAPVSDEKTLKYFSYYESKQGQLFTVLEIDKENKRMKLDAYPYIDGDEEDTLLTEIDRLDNDPGWQHVLTYA